MMAPPHNAVRHLGIECDECGENPIVGTRFLCLTRRNYDVCRQCWEDNHNSVEDGTFRRLEEAQSPAEARAMGPQTHDNRNVTVHSFAALAAKLNENPTMEDISLYPIGPISLSDGKLAKASLASHASIGTFHLYTQECRDVNSVVQLIAEGLKENRSVFSVGIFIASNTRNPALSPKAINAIKELMASNKTIQFLFVKRIWSLVFHEPGSETQTDLVDALFDSLLHSSLQTFRFEGKPVSDRNKQKAWQAMECNPNLRRIVTTFENGDSQLDILTATKKYHWMQRWTSISGSDDDRLGVMDEICHSRLETVPALYHVVRGQPGTLLEMQDHSMF